MSSHVQILYSSLYDLFFNMSTTNRMSGVLKKTFKELFTRRIYVGEIRVVQVVIAVLVVNSASTP